MKVMMLGASEAGKTTYIASLYDRMADITQWHISASVRSEGERLKQLAAGIKRGEYPNRTDTKNEYSFDFKYNYGNGEIIRLFAFTLFDYRGGAIFQADTDPVSEDVKNQLNTADSLIVFLDASTLDSEEAEKQWRRIQNLCMIYASRAEASNPLSLTIVLTKCDTLRDDQIIFKDEEKKTIDYVKTFSQSRTGKKIMSFAETFSPNDDLRIMLTWTVINKDKTINITHPFYNAMLTCLTKTINELTEDIELYQRYTDKEKLSIEELRLTLEELRLTQKEPILSFRQLFDIQVWKEKRKTIGNFYKLRIDLGVKKRGLDACTKSLEEKKKQVERMRPYLTVLHDYIRDNNDENYGYVLF